MFLSQSKEFSSKNKETNNLKYISTYKMGQIGITKLIEEPYKTSLNTDINIPSQKQQINNILSSTSSNFTNTNNTNSNTNTNTNKVTDNISNPKKLKNHHCTSHSGIHIQSSTNFNNYKKNKHKSNQKVNIMNNKNEKKQKYEAIKLNKNQFSKTTNNLCLFINNNIRNKNNFKNSQKNSFSKYKVQTKPNSKNKYESGNPNYILSSRAPNSIKRERKKHSISNFIGNEKNETNINSFKNDNLFDIYLKTSHNQSSTDINKNLIKKKEDINIDTDYQITDFNTYLKVKKRVDIPNIQNQKQSYTNIKTESNNLLTSCMINDNIKRGNEFLNIKDNIYLSQALSTEENINGKPNIKLIIKDEKNTNRICTESNQNQHVFSHNNKHINSNENISSSKINCFNNQRKNLSYKDLNKMKFESKTYSQKKNKFNYSKTNLKEKKEENMNINNFHKEKNNSKNKNSYKARKNFSLNNSKKQLTKENSINKDKKEVKIIYNSFVNKIDNENVSVIIKNNMINENKLKENIKYLNQDMDFETPEELHYFMVQLTHRYIKENSKF